IMTDEKKRLAFFDGLKRKEEENVKTSNKLVSDGLELLRKGQFAPALQKIKEAEARHPTTLQFLIQVWAEIKAGAHNNKTRINEISKKLDALSGEDRKSSYYCMAAGLVKKCQGDPAAAGFFEKALQMDSMCVEARRELNSLSALGQKREK